MESTKTQCNEKIKSSETNARLRECDMHTYLAVCGVQCGGWSQSSYDFITCWRMHMRVHVHIRITSNAYVCP